MAEAASFAASSAPFLSSRSLLSLKSLLSEAVSHSSLAWSEEFWLDKSGDFVPTAVMVGLLVSGKVASTGEGKSGIVAATSTGTDTGVPGALDRVGEREIGAGAELVVETAARGTGSGGTMGLGAVSPLANTAASLSFKRLKRGGLSCLGGLAGLERRCLSLLL